MGVSIQKQFNEAMIEPVWILEGNQGNQWQQAVISLPEMDKPYRVSIGVVNNILLLMILWKWQHRTTVILAVSTYKNMHRASR